MFKNVPPGLLPVLVVAALAAGKAEADEPDLTLTFGSTIVSTHPDGRQAKLWIHSDHTYAALSRAGKSSGGSWKVKGQKLCLSQRRPFPGPFSYCKTIPLLTVGEAWSDTASNGDRVSNFIIRGP